MQMNENKQINTLLAVPYTKISCTLQSNFLKIQALLTNVQERILTEVQSNKLSQKEKICYPTAIQIPHPIIPRLIEIIQVYPQLLLVLLELLLTQTDNGSNIGQGLKPLNHLKVKNPFGEITLESSPNYLLKLHKVLGEEFIAESIKNDSTSNKIRRIIELHDWTAIKILVQPFRNLSINPNGCILYGGKLYINT